MALDDSLVLLGAGASVEADVPASYEMTERIVEEISSRRQHDEQTAVTGESGSLEPRQPS
jgi:hypothetical protein